MKVSRINHLFATGFFCLLISAVMIAQVKTQSSKTPGQSTIETKVERGEVVNVSGNDLVVKMEDGQIRNFPNVPETARVTVEGKELSIHELKPGMKLERTITTTTTPQTVTTVKTVTGTVWHVNPPNSVTLTLEDGSNQQFTIPKGQKFMVDGKETDAFGLRKGMRVSATKIVTEPLTEVSQEQKTTGQMPPPPVEAIKGPILIESSAAQPTQPEVAQAKPPETQQQPKEIPQTASDLPLIGFVGILALVSGVLALALWSRAQ